MFKGQSENPGTDSLKASLTFLIKEDKIILLFMFSIENKHQFCYK